MVSSLFQNKRHTRKRPQICHAVLSAGRVAKTPAHPAALTGRVFWYEPDLSYPIRDTCYFNITERDDGFGYRGFRTVLWMTYYVSIYHAAGASTYQLDLEIRRAQHWEGPWPQYWVPEFTDDEHWYGLPWPDEDEMCDFNTGELIHTYPPLVGWVEAHFASREFQLRAG